MYSRTDCVPVHVKTLELPTSNKNITGLIKHDLAAGEDMRVSLVPAEHSEAVHVLFNRGLFLSDATDSRMRIAWVISN